MFSHRFEFGATENSENAAKQQQRVKSIQEEVKNKMFY